MKKIIPIILLLLISCKSKAQFTGYVSPELQEYVDIFVKEADRRGINGLWYAKKIDSIIIRDLPGIYLGLYHKRRNVIYINSVYYFNRYLMRKTVIHEIGHSVGLHHLRWTMNELMSAQEWGIRKSEEEWQEDLDYFFKKKVIQNNETSSTALKNLRTRKGQ